MWYNVNWKCASVIIIYCWTSSLNSSQALLESWSPIHHDVCWHFLFLSSNNAMPSASTTTDWRLFAWVGLVLTSAQCDWCACWVVWFADGWSWCVCARVGGGGGGGGGAGGWVGGGVLGRGTCAVSVMGCVVRGEGGGGGLGGVGGAEWRGAGGGVGVGRGGLRPEIGHSAHFAAKNIDWWWGNNNGGRKRIPWNNGVGEKGVALYIFGSENRDVLYVKVWFKRECRARWGMFSRGLIATSQFTILNIRQSLMSVPTFPVAEGLVAGVSNLVGYVFGGKWWCRLQRVDSDWI